jgi:hypothetical protein
LWSVTDGNLYLLQVTPAPPVASGIVVSDDHPKAAVVGAG